ncbi:hypothetical protein K456DRAFT_36452 [Colletotrichum gloeosporioides 23]|nr:hypothetical protein K456DRAFT_36452 [Colletotrichum gloeosporioides 23]
MGSSLFRSDYGGLGQVTSLLSCWMRLIQTEGDFRSTKAQDLQLSTRRLGEHFHMIFLPAITRLDVLQCHIATSVSSLMNLLNGIHEAIARKGGYWSKCCAATSKSYETSSSATSSSYALLATGDLLTSEAQNAME